MKTPKSGFTLIELMIVVAIIGVLAAIAIPNFLFFRCKAKQSEAGANLGAIATLEETYLVEYDSYTSSKNNLGFEIKGDEKYSYSIVSTGSVSFTATANAPAGTISNTSKPDTWTINQSRDIINTSNACTN